MSKEIKPVSLVNPKGNKCWIFTGQTDAEAEAPVLWPPDAERADSLGKSPDDGKDWGQEKEGVTQDEMVRWHHQLNGHEFEKAPGDNEGQGRLACCSLWNCRVRHNWTTRSRALESPGSWLEGQSWAPLPTSCIKICILPRSSADPYAHIHLRSTGLCTVSHLCSKIFPKMWKQCRQDKGHISEGNVNQLVSS